MSMIAIPVEQNVSERLSMLINHNHMNIVNNHHCTLFYLGDSISFETINKCIQSIHKVTSKQKPFVITLKNYDCFDESKYGYPIICPVKSPELLKLRKDIKKQLDDDEIEYSNKFPTYKPHVTLSYSKERVNKTKIQDISFQVNKISLYCGDENKEKIYVEFMFGNKIKKISCEYINYISSEFFNRSLI